MTNRRRLAWWYWAPVAVYCGVIFTWSALPHPEQYAPDLFRFTGDKVLHAIEYGILGVLCYRAFRYAAGPWARNYALALAILAAVAYGASDEFHQTFVPSRESSGWDVLADGVGAVIAACGWHWRWRGEQIPHHA
jgi:VanZ family protein